MTLRATNTGLPLPRLDGHQPLHYTLETQGTPTGLPAPYGPPGDYTVELFLYDVAVGTPAFRVETGNPKDSYTFPNPTPKR